MLSPQTACPRVLVIAPTRELACQIEEEARKFLPRTGLRSAVVFGGSPISQQIRRLSSGCDGVVGTPGRLQDLLTRGALCLRHIKFFILDEADRMLDMGFQPEIKRILRYLSLIHISEPTRRS